MNEIFGNALVLPGWQDSAPGHWQSVWEEEYRWQRVVQKNWLEPKCNDWTNTIAEAIASAQSPPLIVAHSLGCLAFAHTMQKHPSLLVRAAFLVAPADIDRPDMPKELHDFRPTPQMRLACPSMLVCSRNDPYISTEAARLMANKWGSRFVDVGSLGHINVESKIGSWESGKTLLRDLLAESQ